MTMYQCVRNIAYIRRGLAAETFEIKLPEADRVGPCVGAVVGYLRSPKDWDDTNLLYFFKSFEPVFFLFQLKVAARNPRCGLIS